ncbi:MAG: ABC transporter ATP-binding protein [Bacillota bacterium]
MAILQLKNICKSFPSGNRSKKVLDGVSLEVKEGDFILVQGPSGVGKSTLLSIIGCLEKPDEGEVYLSGECLIYHQDHFLASLRREYFGFIFQQYYLIPGLTVLENAVAPLIPLGLGWKVMENRVSALLKKFDLWGDRHSLVEVLSGGEQQRTAIVRAFVSNPKIIVADEPTSNLDEENTNMLINLFLELKEQNHTVIVSTHDPRFHTGGLFNRRWNMRKGKPIEETFI